MEEKIVLYSSKSCGMCRMLKKALQDSHIEFEVDEDEHRMSKNGISHIPVLEVNGDRMNAQEAVNWIKGMVKNS